MLLAQLVQVLDIHDLVLLQLRPRSLEYSIRMAVNGNGNVNRQISTACVLAATPMSFMEDGNYYVPYHTTKPDFPATDCLVQH